MRDGWTQLDENYCGTKWQGKKSSVSRWSTQADIHTTVKIIGYKYWNMSID